MSTTTKATEELLFYDTNYECLYGYLMDDAAFSNETEEEKDHIRRYTYRRDLFGIFGFVYDGDSEKETVVSKAVEKKVDKQISLLFDAMKDDPFIKEAIAYLKLICSSYSENDEILFMILCSYDLLFLSQRCFAEFILHGVVSSEFGSMLIQYMKSNFHFSS